jgi:hypothetical protein
VDPTARRHDGFYLRFGLGIGYGRVATSGNIAGIDVNARYTGPGPAYELLLGGTVGHAFVIGGGFVGQDISKPRIKIDPPIDGNSSLQGTGALGVGAIGPFVDWFPSETEGLHFGAMIGFAIIGLRDDHGNPDGGFAGSLWGGYDFWIASQWSLGAELRAALASGTRDFDDGSHLHDMASTYELLFTALYH